MGFREFMSSLAIRDNDVVRCTFPTDEQHKGRCLLISAPIKAGVLRRKVEACRLLGVPMQQLSYAKVEVLA